MKIAVLAANGQAGSLIVKEALNRDHDVTAVIRGEKVWHKKAFRRIYFN